MIDEEKALVESICICMLAAKKKEIQDYNFEKVTNPAELQAERTAAAKAYMEKRKDSKWLGAHIFCGAVELLNQIDQTMDGKNLANRQVRNEMFSTIRRAVQALSDTFQYVEKDPEVMAEYIRTAQNAAVAAGKTTEDGVEKANEIKARADTVENLCKLWDCVASFRERMCSSQPPQDVEYMEKGLTEQMVERWIFEQYQQNSTTPFSKRYPPIGFILEFCEKITTEAEQVGIYAIVNQLAHGGKNQKVYDRLNELAERTTVTITPTEWSGINAKWQIDENGKGKEIYCTTKYDVPSKVSVECPPEFKDMVPKETRSSARQSPILFGFYM